MRYWILPLLLALPQGAWAIPNFAVLYKAKYGYLPSCAACHLEEHFENNAYGKDFRKAGHDLAAFKAIEDKDSDGDGFSNYVEILAKANPGDKASTPKHPGDWLDEAGLRAPKKILQKAFPDADDFKAEEFTLDDARYKALSDRWGAGLPDESRYALVFPAYRGKALAGAGAYVSTDAPGGHGLAIFFVAASEGKLAFLKVVHYHGSKELSKDDAWQGWLGKSPEDILKDSGVSGNKDEIDAVKKAVARGVIVAEAFAKERS